MGIILRSACTAALVGMVAGGLVLLPGSPASAGGTVITVTTTDDVVDAGDGLVSLREAARSASDDAGVTTIQLVDSATYLLDDCDGVNEDGALVLELDQSLTISGAATIEQTCEDVGVVEALNGGANASVVFDGQTFQSSAEDPDGLLYFDVAARLDGVTVTGAFGDRPAVWGNGTLTVADSTFRDLHADVGAGSGYLFGAFGGLDISDSEITDSTAAIGIFAVGLEATDVEIVGNTLDGHLVLALDRAVLDGLEVRGNGAAGGLVTGPNPSPPLASPGPFSISDSAFVDNTFGYLDEEDGTPCCPVVGFANATAEVSGTSVVGNVGVSGGIGAEVSSGATPPLTVENSTVAENTAGEGEAVTGISTTGDLTLEHVTVSGNAVGGGAEVVAASLDSSGVLIDGPDGCDVASTTSRGGNVDEDGSCGFTLPSDRSDVEIIGLAPPELTAAMPVLLPIADGPGVDLLTDPACGADLPLDQIGRERPQGDGCDSGAVELLQPFSDVGPSHPFFDDIGWAANEGIAGGFEDGTYRPSLAVSRQAMAAFLYRLAGEPAVSVPSPPTFTDVGATHPFFTEIEWLAGEGIAGGFGDHTFRPSLPVSRQAMAAFLYRRAGEPEVDLPSSPTFSDVGAGHRFRTEIEWLQLESITEGYEDGTFRPGNAVSRQAMAAFLHRVAED